MRSSAIGAYSSESRSSHSDAGADDCGCSRHQCQLPRLSRRNTLGPRRPLHLRRCQRPRHALAPTPTQSRRLPPLLHQYRRLHATLIAPTATSYAKGNDQPETSRRLSEFLLAVADADSYAPTAKSQQPVPTANTHCRYLSTSRWLTAIRKTQIGYEFVSSEGPYNYEPWEVQEWYRTTWSVE